MVTALIEVWDIFQQPCGQRMVAVLSSEVDRLRKLGELRCSEAVAGQLHQISASTIDRLLRIRTALGASTGAIYRMILGDAGRLIAFAAAAGSQTGARQTHSSNEISFYDQSGNMLSTAVKTLVYVDNAREAYGIITSVALPNGTSVPVVLTMNAKKVFPGK